MKAFTLAFALILLTIRSAEAGDHCGSTGVWLQILGSGGPEMSDQRASSTYLVWIDGHARILVDLGGGGLLRFEQSGATLNDLDLILLTHLHVDHSADLPNLVKASYFTGRDRALPVYGPTGNQLMPSTPDFITSLFGNKGTYRYLHEFLSGDERYRILPRAIEAAGRKRRTVLETTHYRISAIPVHHGPVPALAWRIDVQDKAIVFSGDMNNDNRTLAGLAADADLLVAHNAVPEQATGVARALHMPPSVIGDIAAQAAVKHLILSHRMTRTLGRETETARLIGERYPGPVDFADDLDCFAL